MKKAGIINRVHKGLRTWLFELGIRVQQTDFLQVEEGRQTIAELKKLINVLDRKSTIEDEHVYPVLVMQAPFAVTLLEMEKQKGIQIGQKLNKVISDYLQAGTEAHYELTGQGIQSFYAEYMAFYLANMNRQESALNELFSGKMNPEGIRDLEGALMMHIIAANRFMVNEWIFKGMHDREISEWLNDERIVSAGWMRKELIQIARKGLEPERWEKAGINKLASVAA